MGKKKSKGQLRASHILVDKYKQGADIIDLINSGKDFAQLARERSIGPSRKTGGDLGEFNKGAMVAEFEQALLKLKIGEITPEPIKTKFGYHVIKRTK